MTERDKVKQKIIALLSKTEDRGANEHEALAAASKAAELMAHYDIEATDLDFKSRSCVQKSTYYYKYGNTVIGDRFIVDLSRLFDCRCWGDKNTERNYFFGFEQDATVALFIYKTISKAVMAELDRFKESAEYADGKYYGANGRTLCTSFIYGMERRIGNRLEIMTDEKRKTVREGRGTDLVPVKGAQVESELDDLGLNLRSRRRTQTERNHAAMRAGSAAGDSVNMGTAINGGGVCEAIA